MRELIWTAVRHALPSAGLALLLAGCAAQGKLEARHAPSGLSTALPQADFAAYITQAKARPPSFILFCSRADAVPQSYLRYLTNSMREAFDLPGTPIRITLREKANPFAHKRKRPS